MYFWLHRVPHWGYSGRTPWIRSVCGTYYSTLTNVFGQPAILFGRLPQMSSITYSLGPWFPYLDFHLEITCGGFVSYWPMLRLRTILARSWVGNRLDTLQELPCCAANNFSEKSTFITPLKVSSSFLFYISFIC